MKNVFVFTIVVACLLFVGCTPTNRTPADSTFGKGPSHDLREQLKEHIVNSLWQWDGNGGEKIFFNENGLIEHQGWTSRQLVTRWEVIDIRTVLLKVENGRSRDLYAVLTFNEDLSSFDGFNFHGGSKLKRSRCLEK